MTEEKQQSFQEMLEVLRSGLEGAKEGENAYRDYKRFVGERETKKGREQSKIVFGFLKASKKRQEQIEVW